MKYLKDLIKENGHKLVYYNRAKIGYKYETVFNYSEQYGGTYDGFKFYNDYYVEVGLED